MCFLDLNLWTILNISPEEAPVTLRKLAEALPDALLRSKVAGTVTTYTYYLRLWKEFAMKNKLLIFPATSMDISLFLLDLMNTKQSSSVVIQCYYALKWVHSLVTDFISVDPTQNSLVSSIVNTAKRCLGKPVVHKQAVDASVVKDFCVKYADSKDIVIRRDVAMCLLMFSGFLRAKELINLHCNDVVFAADHMCISIGRSKMDQFRFGNSLVISKTGKVSCPVDNLQRYFVLGGLDHKDTCYLFRPCFRSKSRGGLVKLNKPLSYSRLSEIFKSHFKEFIGDMRNFGLHSFRAGGATTAAKSGVSDRCLKRHGRWKSESSKDRYIEDSLQDRLSVSKGLGI